jgi:hypothetical protein
MVPDKLLKVSCSTRRKGYCTAARRYQMCRTEVAMSGVLSLCRMLTSAGVTAVACHLSVSVSLSVVISLVAVSSITYSVLQGVITGWTPRTVSQQE